MEIIARINIGLRRLLKINQSPAPVKSMSIVQPSRREMVVPIGVLDVDYQKIQLNGMWDVIRQSGYGGTTLDLQDYNLNSPFSGQRFVRTELFLHHYPRPLSVDGNTYSADVIEKMRQAGHLPGRVEQLLLMETVRAIPLEFFPIIALGSRSGPHQNCAVIDYYQGQRRLYARWYPGDWSPRYFFLSCKYVTADHSLIT